MNDDLTQARRCAREATNRITGSTSEIARAHAYAALGTLYLQLSMVEPDPRDDEDSFHVPPSGSRGRSILEARSRATRTVEAEQAASWGGHYPYLGEIQGGGA